MTNNFDFNGKHYTAKGIVTPKDVVTKFKKGDGDLMTFIWHGDFSEVNTLNGLNRAFSLFDKSHEKEISTSDFVFCGSNYTKTEMKGNKVCYGVLDTPKNLIDSVVL